MTDVAACLVFIGVFAGVALAIRRGLNRAKQAPASPAAPSMSASIQELLNSIDTGVVVVSQDHRIECINDVALSLMDETAIEQGHPLARMQMGPDMMDLLRGGHTGRELTIDRQRTVQLRVNRRDSTGGAVFVLHEITELKHLEVMRSDFVANVSHELRTPVSVIRANAETLLDGALDDRDAAREFVSAIHRNSERITNLVSGLLDLARIEGDSTPSNAELIDAARVIARTVEAVQTLALDKRITIHNEVERSVVCNGDEASLEQVVTNLVENAIKYGNPDGHIWIRSYPTPGQLRVEVIDDGVGVESKHRNRLFERFYRVDKGRSRASGGTGLGLSIVKHLVTNMGGQLGMEPNRPNGSVFWFSLPLETKR